MATYITNNWKDYDVITAEKLNRLEDQVSANTPAASNFTSAYDATHNYALNEFCTYNGQLWRCKRAGTINRTPAESTYWASESSLAAEVTTALNAAASAAAAADSALTIGEGSVQYNSAQALTEEQKQQAKDNIGLGDINSLITGTVKFNEEQTLSDEEMAQAQANIGLTDMGGIYLSYDEEENYLHLYSKDGEDIGDPVRIVSGSGSGSGGGGGYEYSVTLTNLMDSRALTVAEGSDVNISFSYYSLAADGETSDGNGTCSIMLGNVRKGTISVPQGRNTINIASYLNSGDNTVKIRVENSEGTYKTLTYTITVVTLSLSTTADSIAVYSGSVPFTYMLLGAGTKTVHYIMDGVELSTEEVTTSGYSRSYTIPAQSHGSHIFQVYATLETGDITVTSNTLSLGMLWVDSSNSDAIIQTNFTDIEVTQGTTITIPYLVYDPLNETAEVTLSVLDADGAEYSSQTIYIGRSATAWTLTDYPAGEDIKFRIVCRETTIDIVMDVEEFIFPLSVVTNDLLLEFKANGRSNSEANPESWSYESADGNTYTATFDSFGWTGADGWITDNDGAAVLRFLPGDTMIIPFLPFANDIRTTGYTVEVELASRDVRDYESVILECLSGMIDGKGGIGLRIMSQNASLRTTEITNGLSMLFKEDSKLRITFVVEPSTSTRLIYIYINGIMCGAVQYSTTDIIKQANPVGITIGAESCGIDLYSIRCYSRELNRNEQLENYICDKPTLATRQEAYNNNNVLNESTMSIDINKLPPTVPYMIIVAPKMPESKGDKQTCDIYFYDPTDSSKNFTALGSQIDVQGTSSAGYPVKNSKIKLKNILINGVEASAYTIHTGEHGITTICTKVDYASSEGVNNVGLVDLYEKICREQGYLTPPQREDTTVRQGIAGRPIVMFWQNSNTNEITFYAKANMNWDKGNPSAFGFSQYPKAESWEFRNNTSNHCLFKSADMTGWSNDFEARYPEDSTDITALTKVLQWVVSTDTTAATNRTLSSSATYEGVTYTTDSADYRLAKFKNEFKNWFFKDLSLFYYIFTATFLMVDSRAKNMFLTTYDGEKWLPLPYDFDTAIGI